MPDASATHVDLAAWSEHLGSLLPRTPTLRADQIANAVGLNVRTVLRAFDGPARDARGRLVRPWLLGFQFNAGTGQRMTRRISRDAAVLWIAHSSNYPSPADFLQAIADVLANRTTAELTLMQQRIGELLQRRGK